MKTFKHSGTAGDILYSLPLVKYFGGGSYFIHLNQIDWIAQHYYNSPPADFHKGRMTAEDVEFMRPFFEAQEYITHYNSLDPKTDEITHNLDRFRPLFVGHPANYVKTYCMAFGITDTVIQDSIINSTWFTVPDPVRVPNKPIVVNRTARWTATEATSAQYRRWKLEGIDTQSIFVGLPEEYRQFVQDTGWNIEYYPTSNLLSLASVIAGAELFIGNQSQALALAIGLGTPYRCEYRRDLPLDRNECYYPTRTNGTYF